jgi:hypothetical protein
MIACYCRVSSARQKTDSQKPEIRRWLQGNGVDPSTVEWFEDKESGGTLKRSAFDRLQKGVFAGAVKTVVVWKLDRLSRRQRDGVNLLADWCERGVRVVVVTQQIDLSGAVGRMVASVLFGHEALEALDLELQFAAPAVGIDLSGVMPLPPTVVGRLGDASLPADIEHGQPLGHVAVEIAEYPHHLVGGPSLLHGSLLGTVYRETPISGGPVLGEQTRPYCSQVHYHLSRHPGFSISR